MDFPYMSMPPPKHAFRSKRAPTRILRPQEVSPTHHLPLQMRPDVQWLPPPRVEYMENPKLPNSNSSSSGYIIDMIGKGSKLTIRGNVKLLRNLPLRREMNKQLISTYRRSPGNYEAKEMHTRSKPSRIHHYGNGYLAFELADDLSMPEMSEFLLNKGWQLLTARQDPEQFYEKWTNLNSI